MSQSIVHGSPRGKGKVYMSIDVETDGPCVLSNSMLSFAVVVMDAATGEILEELQQQLITLKGHTPDERTMKQFWELQPEAWKAATRRRVAPDTAMNRVAALVRRLKAKGHDLEWVAKPSCFDWPWIKSYYEAFGPEWKPEIGFYCVDIRSKLKTFCDMTGQNSFEFVKKITSGHPITHHAVDDAKNQAVLYFELSKRIARAKSQARLPKTWKARQSSRARCQTFLPDGKRLHV